MNEAPPICKFCLKHIRYVPLGVHEHICPARIAGVEPHDAATVAFAGYVQRTLAPKQDAQESKP